MVDGLHDVSRIGAARIAHETSPSAAFSPRDGQESCNPGDQLVLADVATPADKGKVRVLPATAGTYRVLGIAEQVGVDGQLVLFRPVMIGNVTVAG